MTSILAHWDPISIVREASTLAQGRPGRWDPEDSGLAFRRHSDTESEAVYRQGALDRLERWEAGEEVPHVVNFQNPSDLRALLTDRRIELLRSVIHPFVDGNKRTALMSVRVFYALNGLEFAYDRHIKEILKNLATDETGVEKEIVLSYLQEHTEPLEPEYRATIELWLSRIADADEVPDDVVPEPSESEPNDYDSESRRGE